MCVCVCVCERGVRAILPAPINHGCASVITADTCGEMMMMVPAKLLGVVWGSRSLLSSVTQARGGEGRESLSYLRGERTTGEKRKTLRMRERERERETEREKC